MIGVAVGLGSNVGDPQLAVTSAISLLKKQGDLVCLSSIYESAPMFVENQAQFTNAVALFKFDLGPIHILGLLKDVERLLGRQKRERNGPREIDLDLLRYGNLVLDSINLSIPHPGIKDRRFVIEPWLEIEPDASVPTYGKLRNLWQDGRILSQDVRKVADAPI